MDLEPLGHELRLACRSLGRARAFSVTAVITLAVGMVGVTAVFALVQGVLLRPLPLPEQQRMIVAWQELRSTGLAHYPFRAADIDRLSQRSQTLESVAGVGYNGAMESVVLEDGAASYIRTASVTGGFFRVVGVEPILGRALRPADDVTGSEHVLVITRGLWQRRYAGSPDALGRRLMLGNQPFTIVGVMPPDFEYPRGVEAWLTVTADASMLTNPVFHEAALRDLDLIARLRPGATLAQARSELGALTAALATGATPDTPRGLSPVVRSLEDVMVGDARAALRVLFSAVGLVLLIACANVANLLLLRSETRRRELAMRAVLGAGRARLARQFFLESLVLALVAGAVGLAVTSWTLQILVAFVPGGLPRMEAVRLDAGVVGFTVAVVLLTAALAGLLPALFRARIDLATELRGGARGTTAARFGRPALVVGQGALAVAVVAAGVLLTRSLLKLSTVDIGLGADRLVFVELALPPEKYDEPGRYVRFLNEVVAELESAPGIAAATAVNSPPFSGTGGWDAPQFTAEGQSADRAAGNPALSLEAVLPTYFATFEVPLVRGRSFTEADREGTPNVAILSEEVATRTWPDEDPIGKRIKLGGVASRDPWRTVVGVARSTRYRDLLEQRATLYLPAPQFINSARLLVLRTAAPLTPVMGLARERVRAVDPTVQVTRVTRFGELLRGPLARPRFTAILVGVFGGAALLLAAIGLYAAVAASARRRYAEMGIRIALGATDLDLLGLVLGEGLGLAALGTAIGLAVAVAGTHLLRSLLFDVDPQDPVAMIAAALLLLGVSALASYLPARRAAHVDPVAILRMD